MAYRQRSGGGFGKNINSQFVGQTDKSQTKLGAEFGGSQGYLEDGKAGQKRSRKKLATASRMEEGMDYSNYAPIQANQSNKRFR